MERIVELISQIEKDDSIPECGFLIIDHPLITEIKNIADTHLVTEEGRCNWDNILDLMDKSVEVFPIEADDFGWLVGGIRTSKGIITYG
jgi:hypothetical protein